MIFIPESIGEMPIKQTHIKSIAIFIVTPDKLKSKNTINIRYLLLRVTYQYTEFNYPFILQFKDFFSRETKMIAYSLV